MFCERMTSLAVGFSIITFTIKDHSISVGEKEKIWGGETRDLREGDLG